MMKLNLGCGSNILEGYENYDSEVNLEKTLPFISDSITLVLLDNVLEHVYHQRELLLEVHRILKPNGIVEIYVPFWSSRIEHTRFFYPMGYFNDLCGLGSKNSCQNVKLFNKVEECYVRKSFMLCFPFIKKICM